MSATEPALAARPIVCALRGGEGSRAVRQAAIKRARDSSQPLIFFTVADADSLGEISPGLRQALEAELSWIARTLVTVARDQAEQEGVSARTVVWLGRAPEQIERFVQEVGAAVLMLGAPRGTTATVFGDDDVEQYAARLQAETGVTVEIVRPESVMDPPPTETKPAVNPPNPIN